MSYRDCHSNDNVICGGLTPRLRREQANYRGLKTKLLALQLFIGMRDVMPTTNDALISSCRVVQLVSMLHLYMAKQHSRQYIN